MDTQQVTVTIPRKEGTTKSNDPIEVWPLVKAALERVEADEHVMDAAESALAHSDGCVAIGNFLDTESARIQRMDFRYRVPLLVLAARKAREDGRADSIYDSAEDILFFETDQDQYPFDISKDWTVDWMEVADERIDGYDNIGSDNETWATDRLMDFQEIDVNKYLSDEEQYEELDETDDEVTRRDVR